MATTKTKAAAKRTPAKKTTATVTRKRPTLTEKTGGNGHAPAQIDD